MSQKYRAVEREYFTVGELQEIWDYLCAKGLLCYAGAEEMSPTDKFAYIMMNPLGLTYSKDVKNGN